MQKISLIKLKIRLNYKEIKHHLKGIKDASAGSNYIGGEEGNFQHTFPAMFKTVLYTRSKYFSTIIRIISCLRNNLHICIIFICIIKCDNFKYIYKRAKKFIEYVCIAVYVV